MKKINLSKQPEGILIADLNESHLIAYRETLDCGEVILGTIKKTSKDKFIASGITKNNRYENVTVFKSIQEIVKFLITNNCEVYVFVNTEELFKFFSGQKDKRILVYVDNFDFVCVDPSSLEDEDFIGVEWECSTRGFVVKMSDNKYTAVEINNNNYEFLKLSKNISGVLLNKNIKNAYQFNSRADLVKWISQEKKINSLEK